MNKLIIILLNLCVNKIYIDYNINVILYSKLLFYRLSRKKN